jgi:hypothetical protein
MISPLEKAILEIGAGAWFITAASLVLVFGVYAAQCFTWDADWRRSPTFSAAIALSIFGAGSAMRAGLAWFRFIHGDYSGFDFILSWWPWFEVSILANALGAAIAIYALSPSWRLCLSLGVVGAAFIIPGLIYAF